VQYSNKGTVCQSRFGDKYLSGKISRINVLASREGIIEILQYIPLVDVFDGISKINRVGGVCLQRVFNLDGDCAEFTICSGVDFWDGRIGKFFKRVV
jgi:hypothetical protein